MLNAYAQRGLAVIAIDVDRSRQDAEKFLAHPTFDVRFDPRGELAEQFLVQGIASGCSSIGVKPWQRDVLARDCMQLNPNPYAVDRAFELLAAQCFAPFLINFGGDLLTNRAPSHALWRVGIERPDTDREATLILDLERGALATSGDSRRFLLKNGIRYGHLLDPRSGWPVQGAPRSVTVAASSCTEAGQLSTLALLHGASAREFFEQQQVRYWILD